MTNTYNAPCKVPVDLGFQLSHAKLVQPTQNLVFLGVQPDTVEMSVSKVMNLKTYYLILVFYTGCKVATPAMDR